MPQRGLTREATAAPVRGDFARFSDLPRWPCTCLGVASRAVCRYGPVGGACTLPVQSWSEPA